MKRIFFGFMSGHISLPKHGWFLYRVKQVTQEKSFETYTTQLMPVILVIHNHSESHYPLLVYVWPLLYKYILTSFCGMQLKLKKKVTENNCHPKVN